MGPCTSANRGNQVLEGKLSNKLLAQEVGVLSLIYDDLASRSQHNKLTRDNFRLFFHKTGFWGDRLFKQFEQVQSEILGKTQFLNGIANIFKSSEDHKILLLFAFFSHSHSRQLNGLSFQQFLQVLYNYPKADIKAIMDDHDFLDHNIRKILNQKQKRTGSIPLSEEGKLNSVFQYEVKQITEMEQSVRSQSFYGIQDKMAKMTKMKKDGREIQIKTSSINSLIRKFARTIFQEYNINQKTGKQGLLISRLHFKEFRNWIKKHKNLYHNYFQGFHSDVWQFDEARGTHKYLIAKNDKVSNAFLKYKGKNLEVRVILLQQTLIFTKKQIEKPHMVITLEGLSVRQILQQSELGYGISIQHTTSDYGRKQLFFETKTLQRQWLQQLKFYKGCTVTQKYIIKEPIGSGKFSVVHRCENKDTGESFAIKIIEKKNKDPYFRNQQRLIEHESSIMETLKGITTTVQLIEKIQMKNKTYIVIEEVKGKDLNDLVHQQDENLTEGVISNISKQIISTVKAIHKRGIVHRDLKPENIMIMGSGQKMQIRIIDFGLSIYEYNIKQNQGLYAENDLQGGTPGYLAPESLLSGIVSTKVDNFAIGGIIYFMLCGMSPFYGDSLTEIWNKTIMGELHFDKEKWATISPVAKQLVQALTEVDPDKRISLQQALDHQWFRRSNYK